jgi:hypothetical protein
MDIAYCGFVGVAYFQIKNAVCNTMMYAMGSMMTFSGHTLVSQLITITGSMHCSSFHLLFLMNVRNALSMLALAFFLIGLFNLFIIICSTILAKRIGNPEVDVEVHHRQACVCVCVQLCSCPKYNIDPSSLMMVF